MRLCVHIAPEDLTLRALRVAAAYKVHNRWRRVTRNTPTMAQEARRQAARDLASGHSRAIRVLDRAGLGAR